MYLYIVMKIGFIDKSVAHSPIVRYFALFAGRNIERQLLVLPKVTTYYFTIPINNAFDHHFT